MRTLTAEESAQWVATCRDLFDLAPDGILRWKQTPKYRPYKLGTVAGMRVPKPGGNAHWYVQVRGRRTRRSQVVWAMTRGVWPSHYLAHINGNTLDDTPGNLREDTGMAVRFGAHMARALREQSQRALDDAERRRQADRFWHQQFCQAQRKRITNMLNRHAANIQTARWGEASGENSVFDPHHLLEARK